MCNMCDYIARFDVSGPLCVTCVIISPWFDVSGPLCVTCVIISPWFDVSGPLCVTCVIISSWFDVNGPLCVTCVIISSWFNVSGPLCVTCVIISPWFDVSGPLCVTCVIMISFVKCCLYCKNNLHIFLRFLGLVHNKRKWEQTRKISKNKLKISNIKENFLFRVLFRRV